MRRVLILTIGLLLGLASAGLAAADPAIDASALQAVKAAQQFRTHGEAVQPAPDGTYFCEAEEFKVVKPGWQALPWGENDHAATMAVTFLSRKAFLGAPAQCKETAATINVDIKEAGKYLVLARYEAAYHFQTQFHVTIVQGSKTVFNRLYGARDYMKIWSSGSGMATEPPPTARRLNQSTVWEGHDAYAELQPGLATITLIAGPQPEDAAKRSVDLIMLTRDEAQVRMRIAKENYLPLDGWLTQAGDVWMRVTNPGAEKVTVSSLEYFGGGFKEHSPYWVHIRNWKRLSLEVAPGATGEWTEVGSTMDALCEGQWGFQSSGPCAIEFAVKNAAGRLATIRTFPDVNGRLDLVGFADTRYSHRLATPRELDAEILAYLKKLQATLPGKAPSQTLVIAYGAWAQDDWQTLCKMYGLNGANCEGPTGYVDWRGQSPAQLEATCRKLSELERKNVAIVSLGDEIGLPAPSGEAATTGFIGFLKAQGLTPGQVDPAAGGDWAKIAYNTDATLKETNPGLFYWSTRYRQQYGILTMKALTDVLRKYLPNAGIGANFSPHAGPQHAFLGQVFQWVDCFREDGMTQPWSEDYTWQLPLGTQQMNGLALDLLRAGIRNKPEEKIHYYVMPHMPGNNPDSWRRMFFSAVGHGAKILNLFEFNPVWDAYTENHVTGNAMYGEVLKTLYEFSRYEDIVQAGQVRPARVGLWFSETGDIWNDYANSGGAAKRALYIAILNQQVPLDLLVEQDALDGTLDQYRTLYLTDRHVSRTASEKIAQWVLHGGHLFATAGAGMYDEYNRPNTVLRGLMGVEEKAFTAPPEALVGYIKQDLPFVAPVDTVTLADGKSFPVFGAVSRIASRFGVVAGKFADGSPALVRQETGMGEVTCCAFLPGLSYFKPAIPKRPLDLTTREDSMSHIIPTSFEPSVGALMRESAAGVERQVITGDPLVEASVIESKAGTAIVLDNWRGKPLTGLQVQVNIPVPTKNITLATGKPVKVQRTDGMINITIDLDVAGDVLILR